MPTAWVLDEHADQLFTTPIDRFRTEHVLFESTIGVRGDILGYEYREGEHR
ncbi:MAG: hypothetical protein H6597_00065 [Flavobacteriales bacterium]|nr:hypothetical protein [Flavobacteriales bacterium]